MVLPQISITTLLLGSPILAVLCLTYFRLDEMLGRPAPRSTVGRPLSHRNEAGQVVCIEPDGRYLCPQKPAARSTGVRRLPGHLPRRSQVPAIPRILAFWKLESED